MPFTVITAPTVGETTKLDTFATAVIDDLDFLNDQLSAITTGSAVVLNGSFETGTGADTAPTSWDLVISSGNSTAFETSAANTRHGKQAFSMTNPGGVSGGVTLTSTDFILVAEEYDVHLRFLIKASIATTKITINVKFFDEAESAVSTVNIYDDNTTNPTAWTEFLGNAKTPATAKLAKIEIIGVDNTTAASCYFDGFEFIPSPAEVPNREIFKTSGSFTVPPGVKRVLARMWGGGGGGGAGLGWLAGAPTAGTSGGPSWFSVAGNEARGGAGGAVGSATAGGAGGSGLAAAIGGTNSKLGSCGGFRGFAGDASNALGGSGGDGGFGHQTGNNGMGGLGTSGVISGAGGAAGANSGCGGGGSGGASQGGVNFGGGGGGGAAGEYSEYSLTVVPGSSHTVTIGGGGGGGVGNGLGGSASANGGAGGTGLVIIEY